LVLNRGERGEMTTEKAIKKGNLSGDKKSAIVSGRRNEREVQGAVQAESTRKKW